jgi:hypothetical protein
MSWPRKVGKTGLVFGFILAGRAGSFRSTVMSLLNRLREAVSTPEEPSRSPTVPPSEAYSLLQNERRRRIIEFLATMDGTKTNASTVADHLAELGDDRTACYVSCIQQHLPRLSQSGVIEFTESKEVTVRPELQAVHDAHKAVETALD